MFVRLYTTLYIYISVTKQTCSAFVDWLNTDSACSSKVTGIAVKLCSMAILSMVCAALDGNRLMVPCVIPRNAEVLTCQFWWACNQELTVAMEQVQGGATTSTQGQHYVQ